MTKVNCVSRAVLTAWRINNDSDLDEWLCGVDLDGNETIGKTCCGIVIKTSAFKLKLSYGDWIVEEDSGDFKTLSNEEFEDGYDTYER